MMVVQVRDAVEQELLSAAEVARILGVRPATVRRWCATGILPAVNFGELLYGDPHRAPGWRIHRGVAARFVEYARGDEHAI